MAGRIADREVPYDKATVNTKKDNCVYGNSVDSYYPVRLFIEAEGSKDPRSGFDPPKI